ncbi:MAG TPA: PQQ-binding-like beta-propeller repeat protein [Gemmataceae bacterium]|jgi:outer membrane protein assembly factor BamB
MNARSLLLAAAGLAVAVPAAADWPQWRGPNRDAKVADFAAPSAWPKELTKKWKVTVGDGVATPALVGDKLYTFSRQGGDEIIRCLETADGKEVWQDKHPAATPRGPAARYPGPRSSPAVADGKVVTLGVAGTLSCYDAASGSKAWRKDNVGGGVPGFATSCSPVIADNLCIVQVGGERGGGITAYDLATGGQKWAWTGDGTAYASPVLITVDGAKAVVAETAGNIVIVGLADGKQLWKTPFPAPRGGERLYNACTPVVDGQTVIYSGVGRDRGTHAVKVEKSADGLTAHELWANKETAVQFNTPVVKNGLVFGISGTQSLFCLDEKTGKTAWTAPVRGDRGYGSVVDAGPVLFALTSAGDLIAFEPTEKAFKKVATYTVADGGTYAYPVIDGKRVFVKDKDSVALWMMD